MRSFSYLLLAAALVGCQQESIQPKGKALGQSAGLSDSQPSGDSHASHSGSGMGGGMGSNSGNFMIEPPKPLPEGAGPKFTPLDGWSAEKPSSSMRVAQYVLPKAEGDTEDGTLVVFYFGGPAGGVEANFERWMGLFEQPDGKATKDIAKTSKATIQNTQVHFLDVAGTFAGDTMSGGGQSSTKAGFAARYAILETSPGPFFVRLLGPQKTVDKYSKDFETFLDKSLQPK
jgi:hypothetical protein